MEDLPGNARVDARIIVEQIRALGGQPTATYRGNWLPQGTFDELLEASDREPIHFHPSIHHLHQHWDRGPARANNASGYGPKALVRRILSRIVGSALDRYFAEEQEFRAALAQAIDAIAYRVDEIASADERGIVELLRNDLLDLARSVDERFAARNGGAAG
jgi:hypothetical protein